MVPCIRLVSLPLELGRLSRLKTLVLHGNDLNIFSSVLNELTDLKYLSADFDHSMEHDRIKIFLIVSISRDLWFGHILRPESYCRAGWEIVFRDRTAPFREGVSAAPGLPADSNCVENQVPGIT